MGNAENTSDIRSLTDGELEQVSGGHPAAAAAVGYMLVCAYLGATWDLPVGTSVDGARAHALPWL
jgi:hypothetical protein